MPLDVKLAHFDANAEEALARLIAFAREHSDEVLTVARARHITGHYVHGDRNLLAWDSGRLTKELLEELADGVVYLARKLALDSHERRAT